MKSCSSPPRSGWCFRDSPLYASKISACAGSRQSQHRQRQMQRGDRVRRQGAVSTGATRTARKGSGRAVARERGATIQRFMTIGKREREGAGEDETRGREDSRVEGVEAGAGAAGPTSVACLATPSTSCGGR